jgi:hypothetical protein
MLNTAKMEDTTDQNTIYTDFDKKKWAGGGGGPRNIILSHINPNVTEVQTNQCFQSIKKAVNKKAE